MLVVSSANQVQIALNALLISTRKQVSVLLVQVSMRIVISVLVKTTALNAPMIIIMLIWVFAEPVITLTKVVLRVPNSLAK